MPKIMRLFTFIGVIAITSLFIKGIDKAKSEPPKSTSDKYEIQALELHIYRLYFSYLSLVL